MIPLKGPLLALGRRVAHLLRSQRLMIPKMVFLSSYFLLVNQFTYSGYLNRRGAAFPEWILSLAMVTQANELWKYVSLVVNYSVYLYKKGEPYTAHFGIDSYPVPPIDAETLNLISSLIVASVPLFVSYLVARKQRQLRVAWLGIRRRYRNEIGSARYYLTRPLTPTVENNIKFQRKCRSEETLRTVPKLLPKVPRSA